MVENKSQRLLEAIKAKRGKTDPKAAWQKYWREAFCLGKVHGKDGAEYDIFDNWISGREIRVFRMPGVDERAVKPIVLGVNDLIRELGLPDFLIDLRKNYFGPHESVIQQVQKATGSDRRLDAHELGYILLAEKYRDPAFGGSPHADLIITDQHIVLGNQNWGQSEFNKGYIVMSLPGERQGSSDFLRRLAKHEAGHLFGFNMHHDSEDIAGYAEPADCNMLWRASTSSTCDKCKDALVNFWRGIEERTGEIFLR